MSRDAPKIRAGLESDGDGLLELWLLVASRPTVTDDPAGIAALLRTDPEALLVAEEDGRVVGSLIATWDGWRGNFYRLAVHPDRRRRGLASQLVRAGERRLEELGALRLTAVVADEGSGAGPFWESVGYRRQERTSRYVRLT